MPTPATRSSPSGSTWARSWASGPAHDVPPTSSTPQPARPDQQRQHRHRLPHGAAVHPELPRPAARLDGPYTRRTRSTAANPLQTIDLVHNDEDVWRFIGSGRRRWQPDDEREHRVRAAANLGVDRFQQQNELRLLPARAALRAGRDGLPGTSLFGTSEPVTSTSGINRSTPTRPHPGCSPRPPPPASSSRSATSRRRYIVSRNLNAGQPNVDSGTQRRRAPEPRAACRDRGFYLPEEDAAPGRAADPASAPCRLEQSTANGDPNERSSSPRRRRLPARPLLPPGGGRVQGARRLRRDRQPAALRAEVHARWRRPATSTGNPACIRRHRRGRSEHQPERQRGDRAGVDAALLDGDAVVELTVYQRTISDLLLQRLLAPSTGFTTQFFNGGELRNRGVEAMVQVTPLQMRDASSG